MCPALSATAHRFWTLLAYRYLIGTDLRDSQPQLFFRLQNCYRNVRMLQNCHVGCVTLNTLSHEHPGIQHMDIPFLHSDSPAPCPAVLHSMKSRCVRMASMLPVMNGLNQLVIRNSEIANMWAASAPQCMGFRARCHRDADGNARENRDHARTGRTSNARDPPDRVRPRCSRMAHLAHLTQLQRLQLQHGRRCANAIVRPRWTTRVRPSDVCVCRPSRRCCI